ncbi:MAG TPA: Hint domain-containing protein, partial [Acidiphilium sp.]
GTIVTDNGTIGVTGPGTSLTDTTSLTGNGTIFIDHGAQVTLANPTGNDGSITVDFGTHGSNADPNVLDVNGSSRGFGGTIAGFGPNDQIILGNSTEPTPGSTSAVQLHWNSTTGELTVTDTVSGHTYTESLHLTGTFDTDPANTLYDSVGKGGITISVPCFAEGTRILTEHGEVPVEALEVGDEVTIGREGSERTRRIVWIGHRHIALDRVRDRSKVEPVRILAGAFGANLPARDLTVSPDHALFVDGVLIEAKNLVNGATILRDRAARQVTYYHVELDAHDVLLAEGLPAESYLDDANRAMFANGADAMTLHPDFATRAGAPRCAELLLDGEPVQAVRMLLDTRARELLGLRTTDRPDVTLFANGAAIATRYGTAGTLRFVLPAGVTSATLAVPTGVPAEVNPATGDRRELGLKIVSATLIEAEGRRPVGFEAMDGLFAADDHRGRWSGGLVRIALPEHAEARILEIVYDAVATRWEAVEVAESAIA